MNQVIYFVTSLVIQAFLISCGMILAGAVVVEHFIPRLQEISIFVFTNVIRPRLFTSMDHAWQIVLFLINIDFNGVKTFATILAFMAGLYIGMVLAKLIAIILYFKLIEIISIIATIHAQKIQDSIYTLIDLVWQLAQLLSFQEQKQA